MSKIRLTCPTCHHSFRATLVHPRTYQCPKCGEVFTRGESVVKIEPDEIYICNDCAKRGECEELRKDIVTQCRDFEKEAEE